MKRVHPLNSNKILRVLEQHKPELQKLSVEKIGLFGSYLKKKHTQSSDLDFIVVFKDLTYDNYIELKFLLEKLFRRRVDLVIEQDLKPALAYVKEEALYAGV